MRPSWDEYAMALAQTAALRSEDPYLQVGACILRADHSVASLGYNGAPAGLEIDWADRTGRGPLVVHAETNALRYVQPGEGVLMATTTKPCGGCLVQIAAMGIFAVLYHDELPEHYNDVNPIAAKLGIGLEQL